MVAVVEDLALLRVHAVAKVEDVLLFLVDDLAQAQELALLREGRRLREPLTGLLELAAQRLTLALERVDARLELGRARLELAGAAVVPRDRNAQPDPAVALPDRRDVDADVLGRRRDVDVLDAHGVDGGVGVRADALGAERLARAVEVGIAHDRRVLTGPERVVGQRAPPCRRMPPRLAWSQFSADGRSSSGPQEFREVDHLAARRGTLRRARLELRERRLGLGIEPLALERRRRLGVTVRDALLARVVGGDGERPRRARADPREHLVVRRLRRLVVRAPDDGDVLVVGDDDVGVLDELLDVHLLGPLLAAEAHELVDLGDEIGFHVEGASGRYFRRRATSASCAARTSPRSPRRR